MATIDNKPIQYTKKKQKKRQQIWNYIRRNRHFRVGDVMMICEVNYDYMQKFLRFLQNAGYIRLETKSHPYSDRRYTLLKNTGVKAPLITDYGLYDNNTCEAFRFGNCKAEQKIYAPEVLINILESLDCNEITKESLIIKAKTTKAGLNRWWNRLKKFGVILDPIASSDTSNKRWESDYTKKYQRDGRKLLYKVDAARAKEVLLEIGKGTYTSTNSQMKQLWKS